MEGEYFNQIKIKIDDLNIVLNINEYSHSNGLTINETENLFKKFWKKYKNDYSGIFYVIFNNFTSNYLIEQDVLSKDKDSINSISVVGLYKNKDNNGKSNDKDKIEFNFNQNYFKIFKLNDKNKNSKNDKINVIKKQNISISQFFKKAN